MNKIGFDLNSQQEAEVEEYGMAEVQEDTQPSMWLTLLTNIVEGIPYFAMIYGLYASIRDLIASLF